ncbi:MAG: insulinase family protein [Parachlamydiales bacterium]|nr:insulinase family protein [Parachlamydiales bacterium]
MKKLLVLICLISLSLFFFSFTKRYQLIEDQSGLPLLNPEIQNRVTEKLILQNGMKVYLIFDEKADQSAVALAVKAGSWNDPEKYPGMAHFTEHMLFMGSKKYPKEDDYHRFISERGGMKNAYTASDKTVFMFSINHDSFEEALDRFSHFFIDPLFHPSCLGRELHAVDQENAKNIENDMRRFFQIVKETANQNHPLSKFSTGNAQTLSSLSQKEIETWYQAHYSADQMALCIYSALPIQKLQQMVLEKFSSVRQKQKPPLSFPKKFSSSIQEGHITYIQPKQDIQKLIIQWELPRFFAKDPKKTTTFAAYLIDRGQKNSLKQCLKNEMLINDLSVDVHELGKDFISLDIFVDLTDKGLLSLPEIIGSIFRNLHLLQTNDIPIVLYEEMQKASIIAYQYQSRCDAFDFVMHHADALLEEDLPTYPRKTVLAEGYDPLLFRKLLKYLTVENGSFFILANAKKTNIEPEKIEKWLGGEYAIRPFFSDFSLSKNSNIRLPKPNPFVPQDFSLIASEKRTGSYNNPKTIVDSSLGKFFLVNDTPFLSPEITWKFSIYSPLLDGSTNANVLLDLYKDCLATHCESITDQARQFLLESSAQSFADHLELTVSGFSDKATQFFKKIIREISSYIPTEPEFLLSMEKLQKNYKNFQQALPITQAVEKSKELLQSFHPLPSQKLTALSEIRYPQLAAFVENLFSQTFIRGVLVGNISEEKAYDLWKIVQQYCSHSPFSKKNHPQKQQFPLQPGPFRLSLSTPAGGTGFLLSMEQGDFSFSKRAAQQILSSALNEAFFNALRTKQKTAYIAQSWDVEIQKKLFQNFALQSATHRGENLLYRCEIFLDQFYQELPHEISPERFETMRDHYITKLSIQPKNSMEMAQIVDLLAAEYEEDFSWIEKKKEGARNLTYEEFIAFGKEVLSPENRKKLAVIVEGPAADSDPHVYRDLILPD